MTSGLRAAVAVTVAIGATLAVNAMPATAGTQAGAGETGCPVGFGTLVVSDLVAGGHDSAFFAMVDKNADGVVCGKPLSEQAQERFCEEIGGCTVEVVYKLRDNDVAGR